MRLNAPINLDAGHFFRWWFGELAFLVPAPVRKLVGGAPDYLVLSREGDGLRVSHQGPDGVRELARFGVDDLGNGLRERILEQQPKLEDARVALRLGPGQALHKAIKLPQAAEENLAQVLAFEMDRLTPFKADQVYYAHRVRSRLSATRHILVDLILTPKAKLDGLLEELAAAGFRPQVVDMAGELPLGAVNLLPAQLRPPRNRWLKLLQIGLGIAVLGLGLGLAVLPILSKKAETETLEEQVRKATKQAKEVETLRQDTETLEHQTHFLREKKRTEPVLVDMLEELTRVMPDNTWLNGLQYKDRRIVMQGQSPSASSLIELIEGSRYFKNTSFVSPVTKDTASGLERFQIASDVINGRFSERDDPKAAHPTENHPRQ
jgi:general secretion pathway protein L